MSSFKYFGLAYDFPSLQDILTAHINVDELLLVLPQALHDQTFSLLSKIKKVIPLKNYLNSAELEIFAFQAFHHYGYNYIIATHEIDILRAARLRTLFQLPGQQYPSALFFRKKTAMKQCLKGHHLTGIPAFQSVEFAADLLDFMQKKSFPFIIKPDMGTGSEGIRIFNDATEVGTFLNETNLFQANCPVDLQVEEFIEGQMYHINGFILNGKIINCWPCVYPRQSIEMTRGNAASSYLLSSANPLVKRLNDVAKEILQTLPTPLHTPFHLEVFHTSKDEIIFCEIASRIGGKGVRQAWQESFGISLSQLFVHTQAGIPIDADQLNFSSFPGCLTGEIWFPTKVGRLTAIESVCPFPWVKDYQIFYHPGDVFQKQAKNINDCLGGASLLVASTEKQMLEHLKIFENWFQKTVKWSDF